MAPKWKLYKKLHRWPGLIISFILLYYGLTGIFMNHRDWFANIDVGRACLPSSYKYRNWNNAAIKGNVIINNDSILVYGNIGIWLTDSAFTNYTSFNNGFPEGIDNRKIFDVFGTPQKNLYAATLFGLYTYNFSEQIWVKLETSTSSERFNSIECINDTLYALSRSFLYKGKDSGTITRLTRIQIPVPEGYDNRVTLFQTLWQLHSGEIFGMPGKLFVDILGVITVFLSVTGIIYFFFPGWIKRRKTSNKKIEKISAINKWSLKWHNKLGAWTYILLIVLFFTGIFLRPPLLILIANGEIAPLKFSHLDQPNPWYDKLRDILYDAEEQKFLLSTTEGMFYMYPGQFNTVYYKYQPPVSVMGINTFEKYDRDIYLVGSFSGLFLWNPNNKDVLNFTNGTVFKQKTNGMPVGDFKVSGTLKDNKGRYYLCEYERGILPLWHNATIPEMPENVRKSSKMSLWNLSLEIHTGRFFQDIFGLFYILIVPLAGIAGIIVVWSGYILWKRKYKRT